MHRLASIIVQSNLYNYKRDERNGVFMIVFYRGFATRQSFMLCTSGGKVKNAPIRVKCSFPRPLSTSANVSANVHNLGQF
jgi:hypothetical protein